MKVYYEKSLWDFREECRSDVKELIENLEQLGKLNEIEIALNYEYSNGISDVDLHDLLRDDFDYVLSIVNMTEGEFYEEIESQNKLKKKFNTIKSLKELKTKVDEIVMLNNYDENNPITIDHFEVETNVDKDGGRNFKTLQEAYKCLQVLLGIKADKELEYCDYALEDLEHISLRLYLSDDNKESALIVGYSISDSGFEEYNCD